MVKRSDQSYQEAVQTARRFGLFECIECAEAVKRSLKQQQVSGTHIKIDTGSQDPLYGRIYDDSIGELISTTGHHEGIGLEIESQEEVIDNIHPEGVPRSEWIGNLYSPLLESGGKFKISEEDF